jgi:hypothetical protein
MKIMLSKALVLAVIVLFIGICAIPSLSNDLDSMDIVPSVTKHLQSNDVWFEDFDSYTNGSSIHGQGGWKGWYNNPVFTAYVTDIRCRSSPHSLEIKGQSDPVHEFSGYISGERIFTAWQYIPTDFSGWSYFILLSHYEDGGVYESNKWAVQIRFNSSGIVESDYDDLQLPLITGRWIELRTEIDLDSDWFEFYYDGDLLVEKKWTAEPDNSDEGILNICAVNLCSSTGTSIYYDDLSIQDVKIPVVEIEKINGGFRASSDIKNNGSGVAMNIEWSIELEGGFILQGGYSDGTIATLEAGEATTVRLDNLFGIGTTTITVTAGDASKQASGFMLGPLVLDVKEI